MSHRVLQINELIQRELGHIINQEAPLPANTLVSIAWVKTFKDLQGVKVGLSVFPFEQAQEVFKIIKKRIKQLQFLLHKKLSLKYSPKIYFYLDEMGEKVAELDEQIDLLK